MAKLTHLLKKEGEISNQEHKNPFSMDISPPEGLKKIEFGKVNPILEVYHDPESLIAENFKILRSQLLHPRTGLPSKLIMVTSSIPGEGKTSVALNLAFSFARSVPTIVIDADFRNSSFSEYLDVSFSEGLSEYLLGQNQLLEIVYQTNFPNLFIIPAGNMLVSITKDIFSSEKLVNFLDDLRKYFPKFYVIFDTAPVLIASESLSLSRLIDGVILVVRYAYSERDIIEETLEKLGRSKIIGFVMNAFNISSLDMISSKFRYFRYPKYYQYNKK